MAAVASNPKFAKKAGVPQSVGAEFLKADKGRKFKEGGEMKESKAMVKKEIGFMKKAGAPKSMIKHEESEMKGMKKMAGGGITTAKMGTVKTAAPSRDGMATKGKTKGTMVKMAASKPLGMKRGGKTC
jgi:DNA uptake protein ComE-like DNA-binding protein